MKRFQFITGLLGLCGIKALAQPGGICPSQNVALCLPKKHNQCPVCGTMAEPYKTHGIDCFGYPDQWGCADSRITRCLRCNSAFWQDAKK